MASASPKINSLADLTKAVVDLIDQFQSQNPTDLEITQLEDRVDIITVILAAVLENTVLSQPRAIVPTEPTDTYIN